MPTQIWYRDDGETSQTEVNSLHPFPVKIVDLAGNTAPALAKYCAVDTLVKPGEGILYALTFSQIDAAPTAGTIIVYDNIAESGTILFSSTWTTAIFYPTTVTFGPYGSSFLTGLYVGFTTTADIGVTVSYR